MSGVGAVTDEGRDEVPTSSGKARPTPRGARGPVASAITIGGPGGAEIHAAPQIETDHLDLAGSRRRCHRRGVLDAIPGDERRAQGSARRPPAEGCKPGSSPGPDVGYRPR